MSKKQLLLVVGTGRSGSSALARTLSLCGGSLPSCVLGSNELNPTGFWEPRESVNMNIEFLSRRASSRSPVLPDELEFNEEDKNNFVNAIRKFLSECHVDMALIIKDPNISLLMDFWLEAASRENFSPKIVTTIRNPEEVVSSWIRSDRVIHSEHNVHQVPRELFMNAWMTVNLIVERKSRNLPRVIVEYRNLLKDWRKEVERISAALGITFEINNVAVDGFLRADLHRQQHIGPITEIFSRSWITETYATLSSAAQDGPLDTTVLDKIYTDYRRDAQVFWSIFKANKHGSTNERRKEFREFAENIPVWRPE